jgi:carbon storage regulator
MLVLSRKQTESVIIDDHIIVTILSIQGDKVRLGIEAPREMPVHRMEVHDRIQNGDVPMMAIPDPVPLIPDSPAVTL